MFTLDIYSDPICPWCYIGKAKLDQGLARMEGQPFEIRWLPFRLNPGMPPEGMDRKAYLNAKFQDETGGHAYEAVAEVAREAGLELDFSRIKRTPSTDDAHRLIYWARAEGVQNAVVDGLFKAYFEDGRDISNHEVLCDLAEAAGMSREATATLLASNADHETIDAEDDAARQMGVSGAPTYLINARYVIQGAQDPELWLRLVDELRLLKAAQEAGPNLSHPGRA